MLFGFDLAKAKAKATQTIQIVITSGSNRYHLNRYQCPFKIESMQQQRQQQHQEKREWKKRDKEKKNKEKTNPEYESTNIARRADMS